MLYGGLVANTFYFGGFDNINTVRLRWIGDSPQNPVGNPPKSTVEIRVEIYL